MKKFLFAGLALFFFSTVVNAQFVSHNFKPFRVDVMTGVAIPQGPGAKGGVAFSLEPKYSIIDKISVGLRMEAALTARGWTAPDGSSASADIAANGSYLATSDYYYTNKFFRAFSGVGTGIYTIASATVGASSQNGALSLGGGSKFGGMIRSGFDIAHFRFAVEYNLVGKTSQTVADGSGGTTTVSSKNSYTAIKIGFFIGGGHQHSSTVNAKF